MLHRLFDAPRRTKRVISLSYDACAIGLALYASIGLRLGTFSIQINSAVLACFAITVVVSLAAFTRLGLYRAILRYVGHQALLTIVIGATISSGALSVSSFYFQASIPRSVPLIYLILALILVGAPRLLVRSIVALIKREHMKDRELVAIYGAGYSGFQLATALHGSNFKVVAFIDDDQKLRRTLVRDLPVYSPDYLPRLMERYSIKMILLALGDAPRSRRAEIINRLEVLGLSVKTMPPVADVLSGKSKIADIKDVDVEDLLGRDPVQAIPELLGACITGKNVLVTGAGGSIGSELCRQIIDLSPSRLVLFDLNEYNLYKIEHELKDRLTKRGRSRELIALIGSVQNKSQLEATFTAFGIQTVYHSAAYKHVPLIEHNIIEGVKNNVLGTWTCAEAAITSKVESFVLISTDKAVRPTNVMGASKRLAELVLQALAFRQSNTRFTMVRFGNVLGSSGSVVPLFRRQIKNGGPVTVTHPKITRYFMTIPEAAELVIQAGSMGTGGDVFVLDMGKPVKIVELAKRMIHLSGLTFKDESNIQGDVEIKFTGLRPGEKLYEELLIEGNVSDTSHPRIMRAEEKCLEWEKLETILLELESACAQYACDQARKILLSAPTDYNPQQDSIDDFLWVSRSKNSHLRLIKKTPG